MFGAGMGCWDYVGGKIWDSLDVQVPLLLWNELPRMGLLELISWTELLEGDAME